MPSARGARYLTLAGLAAASATAAHGGWSDLTDPRWAAAAALGAGLAAAGLAWTGLVARFPALAPGRPAVRFARNGAYALADTALADGDQVAMIPPVSGGSREPGGRRDQPEPARRILEIRDGAFGASILTELAERLATLEDGAVVGFLGHTQVEQARLAEQAGCTRVLTRGAFVNELRSLILQPPAVPPRSPRQDL